jgi:thiol-disulfide isomerase/thioredoxin
MTRVHPFAGAIVLAITFQAAAASTVAVVDETGEPVSEFAVMTHTADAGWSHWTSGSDGRVTRPRVIADALVIDVIVRAKNYAPAVVSFSGDQREKLLAGKATIVLERGREVDVRFRMPDELTLPDDFTPEVYFTRFAHSVRIMRQPGNSRHGGFDFDVVNATQTKANKFSIRLPKNPLPFYVAIHRPGFLQLFEAGPFAASDVADGVLEIDVPRPAGIKLAFDPGDVNVDDLPYECATFSVLWRIPGTEKSYCTVAREQSDDVSGSLRLTDLAPGTYKVDLRTKSKPDVQPIAESQINPGAFFDFRDVTLRADETAAVRFQYTPFDPDAFRGEHTVFVKIQSPDGSPAAGEKLKIAYFDGHYGLLPLFEATVPDSGQVELTGVTERVAWQHSPYGSYLVTIDERHIGGFNLSGDEKPQRFEFQIPLRAGHAAPNVEFVEIATGEIRQLSDLRGKIVLLEFWATWCGPCQPAMAKLNKLAAGMREQWSDRVALVALSIDDSVELVDSHVKQRGWTAVQQFWSGGEQTGTQSPAAKSFVIDGVPTAFLIDPNGKIVWRGYPVTDDQGLQARIEKLLSTK